MLKEHSQHTPQAHDPHDVEDVHAYDHHHILPLKVYFSVAGALFFLTIVTVWVAQYDFGSMNIIVAMGVAAFKASLVALFFMHLKYDNKLYGSFFVGSLAVLATFIILTMFDTENRHRIYPEVAPVIRANAVIYDQETGKPLKQAAHGEAAGEGHGETGVVPGDSTAAHGDSAAATGNGTATTKDSSATHGDSAAAKGDSAVAKDDTSGH